MNGQLYSLLRSPCTDECNDNNSLSCFIGFQNGIQMKSNSIWCIKGTTQGKRDASAYADNIVTFHDLKYELIRYFNLFSHQTILCSLLPNYPI